MTKKVSSSQEWSDWIKQLMDDRTETLALKQKKLLLIEANETTGLEELPTLLLKWPRKNY